MFWRYQNSENRQVWDFRKTRDPNNPDDSLNKFLNILNLGSLSLKNMKWTSYMINFNQRNVNNWIILFPIKGTPNTKTISTPTPAPAPRGFHFLQNVKRECSIATSLKNIIPIMLAVLEHSEPIANYIPYHFWWEGSIFHNLAGFL